MLFEGRAAKRKVKRRQMILQEGFFCKHFTLVVSGCTVWMKRWSTFSKIWAWTKLNSIAKEGDVRESAINYHITRAPD